MARHCKDCRAELPGQTGPGRPAERCQECRAKRRHRRTAGVPRKVQLTAVPDVDPPADADAEADDPSDPDADPIGPVQVARVARADLRRVMSAHPAADTLMEVATLLAEALDAPPCRADPRAMAAVSKELRATLADLVRAEEAADADPFGADDVPAPVVVSPAS